MSVLPSDISALEENLIQTNKYYRITSYIQEHNICDLPKYKY